TVRWTVSVTSGESLGGRIAGSETFPNLTDKSEFISIYTDPVLVRIKKRETSRRVNDRRSCTARDQPKRAERRPQ
ncbi:MAG: hypothetical protein IJK23_08870, partial [Clostridia bacterium]|nr:hypothetical protein [Clostridia bacterium]